MNPYYGTGAVPGEGGGLADTREAPKGVWVGGGRLQEPEGSAFRLARGAPVRCALVLDLGNSRTAGLILDDYQFDQTASRRDMHIIPLEPVDYASGGGRGAAGGGVMDSVLTAEDLGERISGYRPLSFMRAGNLAWTLEKRVRGKTPTGERVRTSFASPKLTFWSEERIDGLRVVVRGTGEQVELGEATEEQRHRLERESDLVGEMVLELLEQAETQVNRWAEKKREEDLSVAEGPRRIDKVAVSYPASWTPAERKRYLGAIQRKLDGEWSRPLGLRRVEVVPTVDEATAVLLAYATNNVDSQGGGQADADAIRKWVEGIGGKRTEGTDIWSAEVGVIDIGGGTTDMAVIQMGIFCGRGDPVFSVKVEKAGGICVAGNEYLKRVAERVALPALWKTLRGKLDALAEGVRNRLARDEVLLKRYCKDCFHGMALSIAMQDAASLGNSADDLAARLEKDFPEISGIDFSRERFKEELLERGIGGNVPGRLKELAEEMFEGRVIAPFLESIRERTPTKILLSGKPFELAAIRETFRELLPPGLLDRVSFMGEFEFSGYWKAMYKDQSDVKLLTAIGGATAFLVQNGASRMPVWHRVDLRERGGGGLAWKFAKGRQEDFAVGETEHMFGGRQEGILKWNRDFPVPSQVGYVVTLREECGGKVRLRLTEDGEIEPATEADAAEATVTMKVDSGESNWVETGGLDLDAAGPAPSSALPAKPAEAWNEASRWQETEWRPGEENAAVRPNGPWSAKGVPGSVRPVRSRGTKKHATPDDGPA